MYTTKYNGMYVMRWLFLVLRRKKISWELWNTTLLDIWLWFY